MNEANGKSTSVRMPPAIWIIVILPAVALLALIVAICLPMFARARPIARRVSCAANMNGIGKALLLYADDNAGANPPNLAALVSARFIGPKMLVCPSSGTQRATAAQAEDIAQHTDYVYVPVPILAEDAHKDMVVLFEMPANHRQRGLNFLSVDLVVRWEQNLSRFLRRLQDSNDYLAMQRRRN